MLVRLAAENFRNLDPLDWSPGAGQHLLLGDNGSGKTSLLEAVYLAATTRSFRTANLVECARAGTSRGRVLAEIETAARATLAVEWSGGRRRRTQNGKISTLAEHLATQPILAWTSAESALLTGGPVHRRRFLDRGLVAGRPAALEVLQRYREVLLQKKQLLQQGGEEIETWNQVLAEVGAELLRLRQDYLTRLQESFSEVLAASGSRFAGTRLVYRASPEEGLAGSAAFFARLMRSVGTERARGLPLLGPHRDDVALLWREQEIRRLASAGERKLLGLALLAAQARLLDAAGRVPLVLLDDADAELDRRALARAWKGFDFLPQLLASSNRPEVFEGLAIDRRWTLDEGRLTAP
jgi:DNA replication and repair protein RecF